MFESLSTRIQDVFKGLRGEVRLNHSDVPFFETETGVSQWGVQYTLQLVTTF